MRIRARYQYDAAANCIEILQIPYSTTLEQIMDKIIELVKNDTIREITDVRDEIGLSGFKLTIDLKKRNRSGQTDEPSVPTDLS